MRTASLSILIALSLPACGTSEPAAAGKPAAATAEPAAAAKVDACALVTQAEATTLFGEAAARETGATVVDPRMVGECLWGHDSEAGSHLLQVRVWGSPQYYFPPEDEFTKPLDVGEKGYVRVHSASGVDIAFVQDGYVVELSYSTVGGASFAKAPDRVDPVKQLAKTASGRL
jgi:hypothetical protein